MGFKNSRRQRKEMTICGGLLLAVLLIVLCFLFAVLITLAFRDKGAKVA